MTYEQYLKENGTLTYTFKGISMRPMLRQGQDLITVKAKGTRRCKKYDVVLYRRPPNQYVLHRIVEVRADDYVILGDNCIAKEYGIRDADIIGVLDSFVHRGKTVSVQNRWYRLYGRMRVMIYPARRLFRKAMSHARKSGKSILYSTFRRRK